VRRKNIPVTADTTGGQHNRETNKLMRKAGPMVSQSSLNDQPLTPRGGGKQKRPQESTTRRRGEPMSRPQGKNSRDMFRHDAQNRKYRYKLSYTNPRHGDARVRCRGPTEQKMISVEEPMTPTANNKTTSQKHCKTQGFGAI